METSLPLPSKGLAYDVPLDKIIVRPMRGGDEKLLSELNINNIETKYLALFNNKTKDGKPIVAGIDPSKLTLGDRLYILLWLRINSYSPKFKANLTCDYCFEKINVVINLDTDIPEKTLPDDFKNPQEVTLDSGEKVSLRIFTVEDEALAYEKELKEGIEKTYLYRLALSLVGSKSIPERVAFLEDLSGKDLSKIKYFHESIVHGPELDKVPYICPKCKEAGLLSLPFRPTWLIPSGTEVLG